MEPEIESSELEFICRRKLQSSFAYFRDKEIAASFYPYIALTHTIRRKGSRWVLRVSDHCNDAPRNVLEAIAVILACKVLRRKIPPETADLYDTFRNDPEVQRRVRMRCLQRGRKRISGPQGKHHSLGDIFKDLNRRFFNDQVELQHFGWGSRRSWTRLGHYDPLHQTITISPVLDCPKVPIYVLSYIVYHEMLHAVFDVAPSLHSRDHPPQFRKAEHAHPHYGRAKKFLHEFCRRRVSYKAL